MGTKPSPKPASLKRRTTRMFFVISIIYVLFVLTVMLAQRSLLYFPTRLSVESAEQRAAKEGFTAWRNDFGKIVGWKLAAGTATQGSVLVVHGNAGCALDRSYLARPIHDAANCDVYILEYPGYGAREGSPNQQSFLSAADEAFALLINKGPLYVVGESIGTGVAAHLVKQYGERVSGMTLFAPYDKLVSVAQEKMRFLPVRAILWDRFDPARWMANYSGPVVFILAEKDEVIPSKFGQRLHDSYSGPKLLQVIPGAGHNDICAQTTDWWRKVFSFWQEHQSPAPRKN